MLGNKLRPLCGEIEKRASNGDYAALLNDCHSSYFIHRRTLLLPLIISTISTFAANHNLEILLRQGCSYLLRVCHDEFQLYPCFFSTSSIGLSGMLEGFTTVLYDNVRPLIIRSHSIDTLCSLTDILNTEVLQDQMSTKGESVASFHPVVTRLLEDVQERLYFLSQTYMRDEISSYFPLPDDLDYPAKLFPDKGKSKMEESRGNVKYLWYPTLERTLMVLSKLYRALD
eukprot:CAMPEP_0174272876 /NCGR_PEP_ID=MMETSP0439-20130205/52638_1 /TAXON_ID=0 /ORGANISM="Stereomyxa ramosa, Strain Chinc5" /LENGTH=227 /DNA_ID=CAMNT_0015363687 /DNA_START=411 /DNA_END=1091 /DNA_ORIENTATION=+